MANPADPNAPDPDVETAPEQAPFGYRDVPAGEKAGLVRQVFELSLIHISEPTRPY